MPWLASFAARHCWAPKECPGDSRKGTWLQRTLTHRAEACGREPGPSAGAPRHRASSAHPNVRRVVAPMLRCYSEILSLGLEAGVQFVHDRLSSIHIQGLDRIIRWAWVRFQSRPRRAWCTPAVLGRISIGGLASDQRSKTYLPKLHSAVITLEHNRARLLLIGV